MKQVDKRMLQLKSKAADMLDEEAYQKYFDSIKLLGIRDKKVHIQVPNNKVFEGLEGNYFGIWKEVFNSSFGGGYLINYHISKILRPFLIRNMTHQKLMKHIGAKGEEVISPGAARSAEELMGIMISNFNNNKSSAFYKYL